MTRLRSTPIKLFLALTLALLPIGAIIVWATVSELDDRRAASRVGSQAEMLIAARAVEGLIGRNALALRVAAYGAISGAGRADPCSEVREALSVAPAVARDFRISTAEDSALCGDLEPSVLRPKTPVRPGDLALWISEKEDAVYLAIGIPDAIATGRIGRDEFAEAIRAEASAIDRFAIQDGRRSLQLLDAGDTREGAITEDLDIAIARQRLTVAASASFTDITPRDRLMIFLPLLMWAVAAFLAWALVHFFLMRPLRRLNKAVRDYDIDSHDFEPPANLGPADEIRELGRSFSDTVDRIEAGERDLVTAVENQRKLVREVHHRVKNNLQVVASLLNIHSRGAEGVEAQAAYAGIGRRVEALSVVHRNHFAEVEDSRGIQLRPLITELSASLRASAPSGPIDFALDLDAAATTQDAAVSAAFFITEIVEHAFNRGHCDMVEIGLRRTSELTARLSVASEALVGVDEDGEHVQFERIIGGLSRQLRSPLDKKLGFYAVELPVFPDETDARST